MNNVTIYVNYCLFHEILKDRTVSNLDLKKKKRLFSFELIFDKIL